jgi:hypothetical protein
MTIINALPFNLQNGTTADATQVMANFDEILNDTNNNAAHNGVNSDITALTALTTPIVPAAGGSNVFVGGTSTGTANAQVIAAPVPTGFTLTIGNRIVFEPGFSNTGAFTLVVNGTTATAVLKPTATGLAPLIGGEVIIGQAAEAYFDGTEYVLFTNANPPVPTKFLQNYIAGLVLSTAGGSGTFGITAGEASDSTNAASLFLASAYTKTTASWTVGTGNGGLDTGSIANTTWYHVFIIQRTDTGVTDVLFSLSPTSPTLPTNYTLFRRIGSMRTDSSAHWLAFSQNGNEFLWGTSTADGSNPTSVTTSASLITLTVPTGVKVNALFRGTIGATAVTASIIYTSPDETDQAASNNANADLTTASVASSFASGRFNVRTNTSAQIRARSDVAGGVNSFFGTYGWIDTRGQ